MTSLYALSAADGLEKVGDIRDLLEHPVLRLERGRMVPATYTFFSGTPLQSLAFFFVNIDDMFQKIQVIEYGAYGNTIALKCEPLPRTPR